MSAIRCDKCDAVWSADAVRDGWCENCGKRLPEYLLHARTSDPEPAAEPAPPPAGEVEFRSEFRPRLVAFLVLLAVAVVAGGVPVWIVTHPPSDPRKVGEATFAAVLCGSLGLVLLSVALARLRAGRLVVGDTEVRFTRPFAGGFGPFVVTDRIPFAAVDRFGAGFTPDTRTRSSPRARFRQSSSGSAGPPTTSR